MADDYRAAFKMSQVRQLPLRMIGYIGLAAALLGCLLLLPVAISRNQLLGAVCITLVLAGGALLILGIMLTVYNRRCPGCKQVLFRVWGKFCPHCGGRLLD